MRLRAGLGAWLLAGTIILSGCRDLVEGLEDSQRTRAALKSELGVEARVTCSTVNGYTSVNVLASRPAGDAAEAKRKITDIVNRTYRRKVERVDVSF